MVKANIKTRRRKIRKFKYMVKVKKAYYGKTLKGLVDEHLEKKIDDLNDKNEKLLKRGLEEVQLYLA